MGAMLSGCEDNIKNIIYIFNLYFYSCFKPKWPTCIPSCLHVARTSTPLPGRVIKVIQVPQRIVQVSGGCGFI